MSVGFNSSQVHVALLIYIPDRLFDVDERNVWRPHTIKVKRRVIPKHIAEHIRRVQLDWSDIELGCVMWSSYGVRG